MPRSQSWSSVWTASTGADERAATIGTRLLVTQWGTRLEFGQWPASRQQIDVFPVERLALEQRFRDLLEQHAVAFQRLARANEGLVENTLDLVVHIFGCTLRNLTTLRQLAAEKNFLLRIADRHRADYIAHAKLRHHPTRHARRALDVVTGTGSDFVGSEYQLFGRASAVQH